MEANLPKSTESLYISFSLSYFLQMSRFWDFNEGKFIRHKLNQFIIPNLVKANLIRIPNFTPDFYKNKSFFREFIQSNINEVANEIFTFIVNSFKADQKYYMIYSDDDDGFKEITPNREDVLMKIAHYFGVVLMVFEPGMVEPRLYRDDTSPKVSVALEFSNETFRPFNYPGGDFVPPETLLAYPYYINNKPTRTGGIPDPLQSNKMMENFLQLLVESLDYNKNYLTENERTEAVDVLMFDRNFASVRNKLISVKVCNHTGRFGVFECRHFHCYACLNDEIQGANGNIAALKCPCEKNYSQNDILAAQNWIIN